MSFMVVYLTKGRRAVVDSEDWDKVDPYVWFAGKHGNKTYAARKEGRNSILLHRVIAGAKPGDKVKHIDGNTMDCRKKNLKVVKA